jgi:hypothetical protein
MTKTPGTQYRHKWLLSVFVIFEHWDFGFVSARPGAKCFKSGCCPRHVGKQAAQNLAFDTGLGQGFRIY